ncbi:MAG: hypothetical protein J7K98_02605 [Candidatus Aenigmarchaeota archaeon]|nr:hypothetical protein [Candidatus Aenigmarchaeota archaeon]
MGNLETQLYNILVLLVSSRGEEVSYKDKLPEGIEEITKQRELISDQYETKILIKFSPEHMDRKKLDIIEPETIKYSEIVNGKELPLRYEGIYSHKDSTLLVDVNFINSTVGVYLPPGHPKDYLDSTVDLIKTILS